MRTTAAIQVGVDFGGTKIEAAAIDRDGRFLARVRAPTPRSYSEAIDTIGELIGEIETKTKSIDRIGVGAPGSVSPTSGLVRNANTIYLNGRTFAEDLGRALGKQIIVRNDANCLALSEALDGAGSEGRVVFAAVLGTGCGGGLVIDGRLKEGAHGIAGEWGHMPLPWPRPDEVVGSRCWCGKQGCLETWISGSGFSRSHRESTGRNWSCEEIVAAARRGDEASMVSFDRYLDRLARALSVIVNIVDPDVFVFGGGMSNVDELYQSLPSLMRQRVFAGSWNVPVRRAKWGDSSGVRGAARLWEDGSYRNEGT